MKLSQFKSMIESASDNAEIKVKDGEIVIIEPKPIEYKFKVGDKVTNSYPQDAIYEIVELKECNGEPLYELKLNDAVFIARERYIKLVPQDINDRIKTFEDAVNWCKENGHSRLILEYNACAFHSGPIVSKDILAYLKLRIITCALNEGWEPTGEDYRYAACYDECLGAISSYGIDGYNFDSSIRLYFKSRKLAEYAARQFRDIYTDFCEIKKENDK